MFRYLRAVREKAGLTQEQLAELVGVKRTAINKIEAGTRSPSLKVGLRLQTILGVPIARLLESASDRKPA